MDLARLRSLISPCRLCPRECGAERASGATGFCGCDDRPLVGSAGPHHGEESVLVGRGGSGTIFLAGCNLGCRFCQNWDLSHGRSGSPVSTAELTETMLRLAAFGCENINFVTPTHFAPAVAEALELARERGLTLPAVWNCGGYESAEALRCLDGLVDIYMPDLKTLDSRFAADALAAADYPEAVRRALLEMQRQVGDLATGGRGTAARGLLVRHLVMPGRAGDTRQCLEFLAREVSPRAYVSVMGQYHPRGDVSDRPELLRRPSAVEVREARRHALELGLRLAEG